MKTLIPRSALIAFLVMVTGAVPCTAQEKLAKGELEQIAEEAFIYGFPMVVGYGVLYEYAVDTKSNQYKAPFNQIYTTARVYTPKDTAVVTPNSDTPYSFVWADLRAEPLVVSVPEVEKGRYYSVQLTDLYTFNYGYIGSRTTGNGAGTYMIAGPGWTGKAPPGISKVFQCETSFSLVLFRTQLFGPGDIENVKKVQAGYKVRPLSAFLNKPAPAAAPAIAWPKFDKMSAQTDPFAYLSFLLQFCPLSGPAEAEKALRARFARIGIEAGKPFALDKLTAELKAGLAAGIKSGFAKIKDRVETAGTDESGWRAEALAGDRAFFNGDWLLRAAGAMAGIYGNSAAEAWYALLSTDSAGNTPDCARSRYTMTFQAGELPPVNAFWSVTIYDAGTQLLIENPINRYLINSPMLPDLKKNADGSVTVYIQKDSPGKEWESNWLPAPDGAIYTVLRLYWPKKEALDGAWKPPPVVWAGPAETPAGVRRFGDKSVEEYVRTDERYGHDGLFQGPRGWGYWNYLEHPRPIQNPNLWPDMHSTYFLGRLAMPAGGSITFHFTYPHARYFQLALYKEEHGTFVSTGQALSGAGIDPDRGSTNPFRVGADRLAEPRSFTLRLLADDPPAEQRRRAANTLYAGRDGAELEAVMRIYLADQGSDGAGWGPAVAPFGGGGFPVYEGALADGTKLSAAEVVEKLARPFGEATKQPLTAEQWEEIVRAKTNDPALDPATAPARKDPTWEKYWNIRYSILGAFLPPEDRAKIPYDTAMDGGGDPTTQYMLLHLSRKFGPVYVMRGRMPTFPDTYAGPGGRGLEIMPHAQTQYWSLVSCEAAPSGHIVDGLMDMQVPLDKDGNYTIVYSRTEDRPKNATPENGVAWIEWSPRGEGLSGPGNRPDFGMLMLRIMATNPRWKERPDNVLEPGTEESVMGPYLPRGEYMDKETFEARGTR